MTIRSFLRQLCLSTASLAALLTGPAYATQIPLTTDRYPVLDLSLNSAVLFALHNNPDIEILLERHSQTISNMKDARSALYPEIRTSATVGHEYNNPSSTNGKSAVNGYAGLTFSIEQNLFDGMEIHHTIASRDNDTKAAYWLTRQQIERTLTDAAGFYMEILRYQEELILNQELLADIKDTLAFINDQYEAGAADKVILDYANSRHAFAATQLNRTQASLKDAISNLEFLTGKLPPKFKTYYPERLNPDKLDLQYYLTLADKGNSQLIAAKYEVESAQHRLAAQRGRDLPEVNFVVDMEQTHNSGGETGINRSAAAFVRFDYTLFDGFKRKHVKNRIRSEINETEIRRRQILKNVRRDIKLAYNQIRSNVTSLHNTDAEIRSSLALKILNQDNFRLGTIDIIQLIESAERLNAAKIKKVELMQAIYTGSYNLLIQSSMIGQDFFCVTCDPT